MQPRSIPPRRLVPFVVLLAHVACAPAPTPPGDDAGVEPERTAFTWRAVDVPGLEPTWGAFLAANAEGGGVLLGGVRGTDGPVLDRLLTVSPAADGVDVAQPGFLDAPRYCGCALYDDVRDEVIVLGGRGAQFRDAPTAYAFSLASETGASLDDQGAADFPVGCTAFFFPAHDVGYVFGGLSSGAGFTGATWRYDPSTRTFSLLDVQGPSARYDAAAKVLDEDRAVLVGGMGLGALGPALHSDVWIFSAEDEAWSLVEATTETPQGRRVPWTALGPDDDTLLFGFGSDSPQGSTVLSDLWRFSLSTGAWSEIEAAVEGDAAPPAARGFAVRLPGPSGSVGLLAGGLQGNAPAEQAWVLLPPDDLAGPWR